MQKLLSKAMIERLPCTSEMHTENLMALNVIAYVKLYYNSHYYFIVSVEESLNDYIFLCYNIDTNSNTAGWRYITYSNFLYMLNSGFNLKRDKHFEKGQLREVIYLNRLD